jgi:bifunctional non-homologous end joining protein LigD
MLARSGQLPTRGDWAYEVKWDGFRAIVSTDTRFRVRSRRGWNMTDFVPELAALPAFATFDGELCAFGPDGSPDFPLICERMLMRHTGIRVTYMIFDLLSLDGHDLTRVAYSERRAQLEALDLNGVYWQTPRPSMMVCRSFRRSASTSLRVWLRSEQGAAMGQVSEAG